MGRLEQKHKQQARAFCKLKALIINILLCLRMLGYAQLKTSPQACHLVCVKGGYVRRVIFVRGLCVTRDLGEVRVKMKKSCMYGLLTKREAILTEQAWSIKDLLYRIKHHNMINVPCGT